MCPGEKGLKMLGNIFQLLKTFFLTLWESFLHSRIFKSISSRNAEGIRDCRTKFRPPVFNEQEDQKMSDINANSR